MFRVLTFLLLLILPLLGWAQTVFHHVDAVVDDRITLGLNLLSPLRVNTDESVKSRYRASVDYHLGGTTGRLEEMNLEQFLNYASVQNPQSIFLVVASQHRSGNLRPYVTGVFDKGLESEVQLMHFVFALSFLESQGDANVWNYLEQLKIQRKLAVDTASVEKMKAKAKSLLAEYRKLCKGP